MLMSLQAASGRPDFNVILWAQRAGNDAVAKDDLGEVPFEFTTLDQKFAAALMGIVSGDLLTHLSHMTQAYLVAHSRPLPALVILREIYDTLRTTGVMRRVNTITDIQYIVFWG